MYISPEEKVYVGITIDERRRRACWFRPGPSAALVIGHYSKGFNEWVPLLGGMAPTSSKKVLGWRPLSW